MSEKVVNFPRGAERRNRLNLKKYRVSCQVTERWLQFPTEAHKLPSGDFMVVDVMTLGGNGNQRKICELVLTKQDFLQMLEHVKTVA